MRCSWLSLVAALVAVASPVRADSKPAKSKNTVVKGKELHDWVADMNSRDPSVAETAMQVVISRYGTLAQKEAGPVLIRRLRDPDVSVKTTAALAISTIGLDPKDVKLGVTRLAERVREDRDQKAVRFYATMALARLKKDAQPAIPVLLSVLGDSTCWQDRKAAAYALGMIATDDGQFPNLNAVASLIKALEDRSVKVRLEAEISLIRLGPPAISPPHARELRQHLFSALEHRLRVDKDKVVVIWAHVGLVQTRLDKDYQPHIKAVIKLLKDPEVDVRVHAAHVLGGLGGFLPTEAKGLIPPLIAALRDDETVVAAAAAGALFRVHDSLTGRDLDAIARLVRPSEEIHVRCHAAQALGMLQDQAKPYLGDLIGMLQDKERPVVISAVAALVQMGPVAMKDAVPALTRLKDTKDEAIRAVVVDALVQITRPDEKPKDKETSKSP